MNPPVDIRQAEGLRRLSELMLRVNSSADLPEVFAEITSGVVEVLGYELAFITEIEGDRTTITAVSGSDGMSRELLGLKGATDFVGESSHSVGDCAGQFTLMLQQTEATARFVDELGTRLLCKHLVNAEGGLLGCLGVLRSTELSAPDKEEQDLFPKLRSHPGYFAEKGYRVLAGWSQTAPEVPLSMVDTVRLSSPMGAVRVRQDPGPKNALGRIKFNMANQHAIYLHDTPDRHLFNRSARNFSSGCIRLEKPVELAELLLSDQAAGWPPERLNAAIEVGETRTVALRKRWPVYLVYQTAWVDGSGELVVRDDIYGLRAEGPGTKEKEG